MTDIFFGCKQLFLGTIRMMSEWLRGFGLTPARFNMLVAIATPRRGISQRMLRSILGVSAPTVSRMLRSLEDLGLVVRTPHPRNRRHRWISVTSDGSDRLRAAMDRFVATGEVHFHREEMLNPAPGDHAAGEAAIRSFDDYLTRARAWLGDTGFLQFSYDAAFDEWTRGGLRPTRLIETLEIFR